MRDSYVTIKGRKRSIVVWEEEYGKIPTGYDLHHINFDKTDDSLDNLLLCSRQEHMRLHSKMFLKIDNIWHKLCPSCKKTLSLDRFYKMSHAASTNDGVSAHCRSCSIQKVIDRRERNKESLPKKELITPYECPYCKKLFTSVYRNKHREEMGGSYWGNGQKYNHRAPAANFNKHVKACKRSLKIIGIEGVSSKNINTGG